uniref:Sialin n=1 Tax=Arion vulgaris TaxID=1028688 RepID=A0A0B7A1X2_9EUPU
MPAPAAWMPGTMSRIINSQNSGPAQQNSENSILVQNNDDNPDEVTHLLPSYADVERKRKQATGSQCFEARHMLAVMAFLGFFNVYCLRVNLSVALVAMVNTSQSASSSNSSIDNECPDPYGGNSSAKYTGEFNWDQKTQGNVLGAFFYGYIITQLPGGWLASRFGGKRLLGFGILGTALLTIITPFAARYSVYLMIAVRVLEGVGEGVTFPAMHAMWGRWAPVWERSKLVSFTYAGAQLGTVFSMPISGLLCASDFAGGWPSVFYVFGILGCVWFVAWMLLVHDTPSQHPRISTAERDYIENSIGTQETVSTPWKQILTSSAVWGMAVAHFANNWGFYTLLTSLPTYMKNILKFDMKENGLLSAIPYAVCWVVQNLSGLTADYLRSHGYISTGNTRKLFNTLGTVIPGIMLIIVGYVGCDHVLAMVFLTLSVGFGGCTIAGYNVNHLDIAPKFAGILCGITNAVATIPGFIGPAVVGYLTNNNETRGQWQIIFYITASIYLTGAIVFIILAKGEEMSWSRAPPKENEITTSIPSSPSLRRINNDPPPVYTE